MSVALITTFYGAVLANLFFLPFAEKINSRNKENTIAGELVIEGLCLIHQKKHPIERKLRQLRQGVLNGNYNIQTVKDIYQEYLKNRENNNYSLTEILANKI